MVRTVGDAAPGSIFEGPRVVERAARTQLFSPLTAVDGNADAGSLAGFTGPTFLDFTALVLRLARNRLLFRPRPLSPQYAFFDGCVRPVYYGGEACNVCV